MGFIGRLLALVGVVVAIGLAIWMSVTLFALLMIVGGLAILGMAAKQFLVAKGILNPSPGVPFEPEEEITVIDGEFEQIENPMIDPVKKK